MKCVLSVGSITRLYSVLFQCTFFLVPFFLYKRKCTNVALYQRQCTIFQCTIFQCTRDSVPEHQCTQRICDMQSLTKDTQTHTQLMVAMMMSKSRSMSLILIYDDRVIFDRRLLDILWFGTK